MSPTKKQLNTDKLDQILAEARNDKAQRGKTYRERALKMFPPVCGKCSREFAGKQLRELTVHHKDHNHDNNPHDGSNWELLCLYCHDNEHSRYLDAEQSGEEIMATDQEQSLTHNPFAGLEALLKNKK
jgi:HNH endonuclease